MPYPADRYGLVIPVDGKTRVLTGISHKHLKSYIDVVKKYIV